MQDIKKNSGSKISSRIPASVLFKLAARTFQQSTLDSLEYRM